MVQKNTYKEKKRKVGNLMELNGVVRHTYVQMVNNYSLSTLYQMQYNTTGYDVVIQMPYYCKYLIGKTLYIEVIRSCSIECKCMDS